MIQEAGTADLETLLSTARGVRAAAGWLVRAGALHQFSLKKVQRESEGTES